MPANPSGSDLRHTYIPEHVKNTMAKQMAKNVPAHMQKYVGAYVEQASVNPTAGMSTTGNNPTGRPSTYRPVTHLPRDSHYQQYHQPGAQPAALYPAQTPPGSQPQLSQAPSGSPQPPAAPAQPYPPTLPGQPPAQSPPPSTQQPYDFFLNPEPNKPKRSLPGGGSLMARIGFAAGGLLVLLILFSVVRGLLAGDSPLPAILSITQDQQSIIGLVEDAQKQEDLSSANRNFATTAQLSLATSQTETIDYLTKNGKKVEVKQLNLKIDPKLAEELEAAAAATTYNQTFKEIMQTKMNSYMNNLQSAYQKTPGKNGRALLTKNYNQAELLLKQLNSGDTTPVSVAN